jgi:hypothetical protein
LNSFYRIVMEVLKTHYPNSDHRCVCRRQRDDWGWADHATDEVVEALTTEIGLADEMGQDPDIHHIITRYVNQLGRGLNVSHRSPWRTQMGALELGQEIRR